MSYSEEHRADDVLYAELRAIGTTFFRLAIEMQVAQCFFKYLLDNYADYNEFLSMNRFYCPVSGSLYHLTQNQNLFMQTTAKPENQPVEASFVAVGHVHVT